MARSIAEARRANGDLGERLARWFLERRGYVFREAGVRIGRYEIDLIVTRGDVLVFVEVKWRGPGSLLRATASVGGAQRRRLAVAAQAYAARAGFERLRLDVVAIDEEPSCFTIVHVKDAFGENGVAR